MFEFFVIAFGLTYILTGSALLRPVRALAQSLHPVLGTLVACPACAGFWIGVALHWRYPVWQTSVEAGVAACALGAVWAALQVAAGVYEPLESNHEEA